MGAWSFAQPVQQHDVDLADTPNGMYIVVLRADNGRTFATQLIVSK